MTKSAAAPTSHGSTVSSKSVNAKLSVAQKDVVVPEIHPRVRWHSALHVSVFRTVGEILCAVAFMVPFFMLGPSMVAMMYPNVIIPFASSLEWKFTKLSSYSELKPSNLVLDTNLLTPASALHIQLYLKNPNTTFETLEQVVLVIDDGGFDHQTDNVLLCRPFSNTGYHTSFNDYVTMVETCYHYIRRITRETKIIGFGRGIAGNALLAAAVKLRKESCFHFEKIYLKKPISDIRAEFEKSRWITTAFYIGFIRDSLVEDAMKSHGLDKGSLKENVKKVGNVSVNIVSSTEYDKLYGHLGAPAQKKTLQDMMAELKQPPKPRIFSTNAFSFRHSSEEECVKSLHKPATSVLIM